MYSTVDYSNQSSIAFKSRIVFLSPQGLGKVFARFKNKDFANIYHFCISNNEKARSNCYKTNVLRGYTKGVKTCTAGICAEKGKRAPLFWHVENIRANLEKFPVLANLIKGTNAIIIGSKKNYKYSTELFDKFENETKCKGLPTTIIKGTNNAEVSMLYEANADTLYVCMNDIYKKDNYVASMKDLQKVCDVVKISPTDSIEFYDFLPKETPKQKLKKLLKFFWN